MLKNKLIHKNSISEKDIHNWSYYSLYFFTKLKQGTFLMMLSIFCIGSLEGCSKSNVLKDESSVANISAQTQLAEDKLIDRPDIVQNISREEIVDYSNEFDGLSGCSIVYNLKENKYFFYNKEMCEREVSPYSTFKIISTLIGLNYEVIKDENSTMNYDGTQYPVSEWNSDLSLKKAFQSSCIWYFRHIVDTVGQDKVKSELKNLDYGNCDITEWAGSNINSSQELNGFWLSSSLKISPLEQVQVLTNIFEGYSHYSSKNINILKNIMLVADTDSGCIYGKTGTGIDGQAWFVGFSEVNKQREYFAIYLEDKKNKEAVSGNKAKEIAFQLFNH